MTSTFYVIIAYMAVMVGIGLWVAKRKIRESEDFLLAGRQLGPFMMAGTLAAAEIGGGSTLGVASKAYGEWGFSAGWYVVSAGIGIFLVSFVAPYLRKSMATTVPEILARRYGRASHIITTFLSITALFFATAAQVIATSSIIHVVTGMDLTMVIIIAGCVITAYTLMGGLVSVAFTDIVHILVITVGMAIAMPIILHNAGGWSHLVNTLPAHQMSLDNVGWKTIFGLILMYFMTFSTGQEAVQRYFAARNAKVAKTGSFMCSCLMALYGFIPAVIGLVALAHFPNIDPNSALPMAAQNFAPTLIAGVVLASVVAATMSSASGNMLAVSTLFTKDVFQRYMRPSATDKDLMAWSKGAILFVGACSIGIALGNYSIISLLILAFTMRAAGPFAAFVFGLIYKPATAHAGLFSIILGSIAAVAWQQAGEPWGIMAIIFGAAVSTVSFFVISKIEIALGVEPAPLAITEEHERAAAAEE
ncbi:sodium:solute symporter family protein [Desulfobaculum bizertense]|uniref:Solute:Na+ symporter, SSS family n=1 Tax=Desulfobaculum bizertense DSM 18034 TaxID=1121442 RepID=A0A1T4W500_9BACT|nr:sodium/solute symporter [Desulfobaculum bizertense]SKA72336.1 solute:Na+ symporter, SSS family [Desulfobaculum bizertense DSM 18034]